MAKLEDLKLHASVHGVIPDAAVSIAQVQWHGDSAIELTYTDESGRVGNTLLYRSDEQRLALVDESRSWSLDSDGGLFRLVSEAERIRLAHLFDPRLAVHTSMIDPLPHQITAVYEVMLRQQPLRFLLADDPGAGKTIMAGLLIKELIARGDIERCLIVCPGNLVEQWQDELRSKFQLSFEIATTEKLETARTGNWFAETDLAIARLDKLARDEDVQAKLKASGTGWDLIVCDEAHKMSASRFGNEVKYTKRYRLGQLLSSRTRNFLLLTATPHNGKEVDFQLFLALLDRDRFAGRARDGAAQVEVDDLMRRMVKEKLRRFDGQPLFPERIAHTLPYALSERESQLYQEVTEYVRREFNRADEALNKQRRGTVGFALTILQRRLASSPAAIQQSLRRRRERLLTRQREVEVVQRANALQETMSLFDQDDLDDSDPFDRFDEVSEEEVEELGRTILDQATASRTITELKAEIATLRRLEQLAREVTLHVDTKWQELSKTLSELLDLPRTSGAAAEDAPPYGSRPIPPPQPSRDQKIVIFTEHRDTLDYLHDNIIRQLLGRGEAVAVIHGGLRRGERQQEQERFLHDANVRVLLATDAASEGINLQRAHLMINYDLPWNPNRIEQRFGRIHRIGQTEVCHLFNLVSAETREGDVYIKLLEKIEIARRALGGQVFDVLGQLQFEGQPLRHLLIEAIRYGHQPDVRRRLETAVAGAVDTDHFTALLEQNALAPEFMDESSVANVRSEMERAAARRLQPHYVRAWFRDAFPRLGGAIRERESGRFQITHVPAAIRDHARASGRGAASETLPRSYERIVFDKELIAPAGRPPADLLCSGHPLLEATLGLTLERHRDLLRRGAILVDEQDHGRQPRMIFYAQQAIQDASPHADDQPRTLSQRMLYVEPNADGDVREVQHAPYLDFRPLNPEQGEPDAAVILDHLPDTLPDTWSAADLEQRALDYMVNDVARAHLDEVRERQQGRIDKTRRAVQTHLRREVSYWDQRADELQEEEAAGKTNARLNSQQARQRADELAERQRERLAELEQMAKLRAAPPVIVGGLMVAPIGLVHALRSDPPPDDPDTADTAVDTQAVAARARDIVMATERALGFQPRDVELERCGYDIVSVDPSRGSRRFIEVKGRRADAATLTVTRNEIMIALNRPDSFILAMVRFDSDADGAHELRYLRQPFGTQLDGAEVSVDYKFKELWQRASAPS